MAEPVNILTHEFPPFRGGIGVYVHETARAYAELGRDVTVWAPDYGHAEAEAVSYPVKRIAMRGKQDWGCRLRMASALRAEFPQGAIPGTLILAEPGPIRLWMYRRWLGLPRPDRLVTIFHGTEVKQLSETAHRRILLRRLLDRCDCIGVVSQAVRDTLLGSFPACRDRVVLVPGAVRSSWASITPKPLDFQAERLEIVQVGRLSPRKGQLILVEAIARLRGELLSRIHVRLIGPVGKPAYAEQVAARIQSGELPVSIEGALSEDALRAAYESASLVAMPSQPYRHSIEGLGLALLEAQHFGRPVVASHIGGITEALRENISGLLVPPGDPDALAAAITSLLHDPDRARDLGEAGAQFVRERFSWQANAGKLDSRNQVA